jgi:uncharacterized delta-60 repeat protein
MHRGQVWAGLIAAALSVAVLASPAVAAPGDLDPSFGGDGKVKTIFPGGSFANAVAIQADEKVVAVGAAAGPSETGVFAITRYLTDGELDPSFDGDGMQTAAFAGGGDEAHSVAIQANGKIVAVGTDSRQRFGLVRYLSDGTPDPTFGNAGKVRTNLTKREDIGYDVAIQPDGKIVVAGSAGSGSRFAVARYRRSGGLDRSFGDGGAVLFVRGGQARSMALQPDGKIVVTGFNPYGLVLARLRPSGAPDGSFGHNGVVSRVASAIFPLAVTLQPNGKIVVGGNDDIFRCGIARFRSDGRLDRTFSGDGTRTVHFGSGEQAFTEVLMQGDGSIIAAGHVGPHEAGDTIMPKIGLARLRPDGTLDPTWGGDGTVLTRFAGGAAANGAVMQSDGRVVVAGWGGQDISWGFALARYQI